MCSTPINLGFVAPLSLSLPENSWDMQDNAIQHLSLPTTALHGAVLRGQFKVAQPNDTFQKLKFMYTLFL